MQISFIKHLIICASLMCLAGCNVSPFSPKSRINARDVEDLKNNTNGIIAEIGKLRNDNQNLNSKLQDVQQGLINTKFNENRGVQIFQGDGALIMFFGIGIVGMILIYMYSALEKAKKVNQILADSVNDYNSKNLHSAIVKAASYTDVADQVKSLLSK